MTDTALLRVERVGITHDGADTATPADVSFDVRPGDVVLVLGPSGSGKSTLALALDGLIPHDVPATVTGRIDVAGTDAAGASVAELSRTVAMVFQDPDAQIVTGTLFDEVCFGPENLLVPESEVRRRAEAALSRMGLWERRNDNPDTLSGGGKQRLAIAAALAMGSPVLVLDEPTANLDPAGVEDVYAALAEVVAAGDRAVVLVEHNLDQAVGFASRVVVLDNAGRLIADGETDAVLRERAAEFHDLGVWLPTATLAALRLRAAGYALDPLPLTPAALRASLAAHPPLSAREAERPAPAAATRASEPAAVVVATHGLDVVRGARAVLRGIDLEIRAGEFVAVVGANGAGKTTLVQALAGVVPTKRGAVERAGRVGFVFQNPEHQFVADTVRGELAHGLDPDDPRIDEMLERFGLAGHAASHPFLLSGGQKRRLSVGTALIGGLGDDSAYAGRKRREPTRVLALDEPTFGQDRARAEELLGLLARLHDDGTTIVVVTHDMQLVAEHATRVIVVDAGGIAADGTASAVFADAELLRRAGLRPPPLAAAFRDLPEHAELDGVVRVADLPGVRA